MYTLNRTVKVLGRIVVEDTPIHPLLIFEDIETARTALYHYLLQSKSHTFNLLTSKKTLEEKSELANKFTHSMDNYKVGQGNSQDRFKFHIAVKDDKGLDGEIVYEDEFIIQELHLVKKELNAEGSLSI